MQCARGIDRRVRTRSAVHNFVLWLRLLFFICCSALFASYLLSSAPKNRFQWPKPRVPREITRSGPSELVLRRWAAFSSCLELTHCPSREVSDSPPPYAIAEAHFLELYAASAPFRGLRTHDYAGYSGPWIENVWIGLDAKAVFASLYPLIPVFIQNTDICVVHKELKPAAAAFLRERLRPDFIYAMVTQHDRGLCVLEPPEGTEDVKIDPCPHQAVNILHFSAGGYGNVPIPLIKGDFGGGGGGSSAKPAEDGGIKSANHGVVFAGSLETHPGGFRKAVHDRLVQVERSLVLPPDSLYSYYYGGDWQAVVTTEALLALSPRGYGRASFRTSELVQLGQPQLVVWDDELWLPYHHPDPASRAARPRFWGPGGLGIALNVTELGGITDVLCALLEPEAGARRGREAAAAAACRRSFKTPIPVNPGSLVAAMRARARAVAASHFTYQGVLERIADFVHDPLTADLACVRWPASRVGFKWH
jgi:hypothetical protein